jgi:predicted esterase
MGAPVISARAAMIMVHGRNAGPRNILDLVPQFDRPELAYVAPAAAGNTWYPFSFMADIPTNEPGISSGLSVLDRIVSDLVEQGIPKPNVVLLGFSQGACLTAEYAVRHADRFGGVVIYSGGLIGPPGTAWPYGGTFDGTPVFLGCSDVDGHVPQVRVDESAEVFSRMGASVTERIYPGMGHLVNDDEITYTKDLLAAILGGRREGRGRESEGRGTGREGRVHPRTPRS